MVFKGQVLGDPRIALLGMQNMPDSEEEGIEKIESDSHRAFNIIANMMEQKDMLSIMDCFAEKILQNLLTTDGASDDGKHVIEYTLETFDVFASAPSCSRIMCKSEIIKNLIKNHIT
jgi:hypothetical protein